MGEKHGQLSSGRGAERKLVEEVLDRIDDPIMLQDRDGAFRIVNHAVAEYAGLSKAELVGNDEFAFMDEDAATWIEAKKAEVLETETQVDYDVRATFPERGERVFSTSRYPFYDNDGRLVGTVAICRDVTEIQQSKRALERKNERLDEFTSVLSHDVRNPLNVAKSRLTLLQDETDSEHAEYIADALDRIEAIISDTLTLARQEEHEIETTFVQITDLVRDSWAMVDADRARVSVEEEFRLQADPDRIRGFFENLFRNSIEHGRPDATVSVGLLDGEGFYVEDDGTGIPEEEYDRIVEPGHSSATGGTGFGLTIVRRTAEAHDWEMSIGSSEAGGARFEFRGASIDR